MPKKILIVDDDRNVVEGVKALLEYKKYGVLTAYDGVSALKAVRLEKPDLVVLDVMMPGIDGYSVLETIKSDQDTKNIPVIMLTSRDTMGDIEKSLENNADWHIRKPCNGKHLVDKIIQLLK